MMENTPSYVVTKFTELQGQTFINATQLWEAWLAVAEKERGFKGSMHWKTIKGKKYLFRATDRLGNGKSLGALSKETKRLFDAFRAGKKEAGERLGVLKQRLKEQARFCRAAAINRVPTVVAKILRVLDGEHLLGTNMLVVGTNALYAYEAAAGCLIDMSVMATTDMDLLWDHRQRLSLVSQKSLNKKSFLKILGKADRSFRALHPSGFRAVNQDGYLVDMIKAMPKPPWRPEAKNMGAVHDLLAAEIEHLDWLLSSPKFAQTVIAWDGFPVTMVVPDPRAYALHKLWLSKQPQRDPIKKPRDRKQALLVADLVLKYLPGFLFSVAELRQFPKKMVREALAAIERDGLPEGIY